MSRDHGDNGDIVEMDRQKYWIDRSFCCLIEHVPESNNDDINGVASASGDYIIKYLTISTNHQLPSIIIIMDSPILTST